MDNQQFHFAGVSHVRVLVVDDHPNTAHMLARALSRLGSFMEVESAISGYEALQSIRENAVDILITDMMMPEMTGIELIETINDQPDLSPAVIFLLTAHDSEGVREVARRLHVKQVITKPAHPEQICELVGRTINELKGTKAVKAEMSVPRASEAYLTQPMYQELNISSLLWEVAKKFQSQADIKGQLLVVGKTESSSKIRANEMLIRQVLRSLVWNAINNTPKGGTVLLSSDVDSNKVRVVIRDTGYGRYGTIDHDQNGKELTTVKSIVERHGGSVTVENEPGKGTCFTLMLPLYHME
jgi:CheY-like chemotaxis protein